jgi:streptomycin 6-kinase
LSGIVTPLNEIPPDFVRRMVEVYGERGLHWTRQLPALIVALAERWSLRVQPPFPQLTYNYVAPALRADGIHVVLKVGVPTRELLSEIAALRLYDGHGIVRLLAADPEQGAFLLERLNPGTPLALLPDDDTATLIAASIMRDLWRPAPPTTYFPFPTVEGWAAGFSRLRNQFSGGTGPFPTPIIERAERTFADLLSSSEDPVLLHGDLHHDNIAAAERCPWLALDPKGVIGERGYEAAALLHNRLPAPFNPQSARPVLSRRLDILAAELGIDRFRLRAWGFAQTVLSAWWTYEDHGHGWEPDLAIAEVLLAA